MQRIKILMACFLLFGAVGQAYAEHKQNSDSAVLSWNANSESDLGGYRLHQGTASGVYTDVIDVGNTLSLQLNDLTPGTYFWALTAYDISQNESGFSMEVTKTIEIIQGDHTPPVPPSGFEVVLQELAQAMRHLSNVFVALTGDKELKVE